VRDFDPRLYLVTDTVLSGGRGVVETVRQAVLGGVTAVQVRAKHETAADALRLLVEVGEACRGRARVLMNDRVDVYLAARDAGAPVHGVHVGQHDLPVLAVRRLVGPDAVVGLSAGTWEAVAAAGMLPAGTVDYLGIGAIRSTRTKPDAPTALGTTGFAQLCRLSPLPCVAIGGIGLGDLAPLRRAGAAGAAVVSAICAADDAGARAGELRAEWDGARA
jgi:thiamine-phosphate pyrophosphorylase